ncbi:ABC transporter substrate-binding protein [Brevibacillus choshinensis]|uniref:ABC transporter substrate-binding protein n=2 Tax=Brevibacillus choshinensis TaxID=54911 RepID=UPI002E24836B|nr:ABC transporter substrate-binding protein [Brevibacillus choshinensis]
MIKIKDFRVVILTALVLMLVWVTAGCGGNVASNNLAGQTSDKPADTQASSGTPKPGGTLIVGTSADLTKLDLHSSTVLSDRIPLLHVQEMLVTIDEKMNIIPLLAEKWETSQDGKTVTFPLRKGVTFHNGKEMKSEDVKYSIERFMKVAARKGEFSMVESIESKDDFTVVFHLKEPSGVFLASLANPYNPAVIMPKGIAEEQKDNIVTPIGTGPFQFVKWEQGKQLVLKRFDKYVPAAGETSGFGGAKKPYVDEVVFKPISEASVRLTALETGEIDLATDILPKDVKRLSTSKELVLSQETSMNWGYLFFGFKKPPFDNLKMRQAVAYAINKKEIVDVATWGLGKVASSPVYPETEWYSDAHAADYQQDLEKAKQLLKEAGYNGEKITISTAKAYDHHQKAAMTIQGQLKKIGMNVDVEILEWASFISERANAGDYHLAVSHITPRPDPNQIYYAYTHSKSNFNGYKNPKMDELLEKGLATVDQKQRKEIYNDVQKLLREDLSFMSTYYYPVIEAHQAYLKGYIPWSAGYPRLWNVWLDK